MLVKLAKPNTRARTLTVSHFNLGHFSRAPLPLGQSIVFLAFLSKRHFHTGVNLSEMHSSWFLTCYKFPPVSSTTYYETSFIRAIYSAKDQQEFEGMTTV
jgi:hypothetical protein